MVGIRVPDSTAPPGLTTTLVRRRWTARRNSGQAGRYRTVAACLAVISTSANTIVTEATAAIQPSAPVERSERPRPVTSTDLVTAKQIGGASGWGLSVSPDAKYIAFEMHQANLSINDYRVRWLVAPIERETASPIDVGDAGDPNLFRAATPGGPVNGAWLSSKPTWSPDSLWIVYRKKLNKEIQLWASSRDGRQQRQLTYNQADVVDFRWSSDGGRIYFATDAPREELAAAEQMQREHGYLFDYEKEWATFHGQPYRAPYALTGGKPLHWVYDWHSGVERPATAAELRDYEGLASAKVDGETASTTRSRLTSPDRKRVAWLEAADPEKQGVRAPLTVSVSDTPHARDRRRCMAIECTGQILIGEFHGGLAWDSAGEEIFFFRMEGKAYSDTALYGWHPQSGRVRAVFRTNHWISDCSHIPKQVVCFSQAPNYPRRVVTIDLPDGAVATLFDPNPEFKELEFGEVEGFSWGDNDGNVTHGFLIKPRQYKTGTQYPLVIVGYRARHALYGGVGHELPAHQLAGDGIMVLVYERPIPWETHAVEGDPRVLSMHDWGPNMYDYRVPLSLFESAIEELSDRGLVDRRHVGIAGFSNGANHVAYALAQSDIFAAATMGWSVYSPCVYFVSGVSGSFRTNLQAQTGAGRPGSDSDWKWQQISPALNAERLATPLLIQSSDFEHIRALQDVVTLTEAGKSVEMHVFPDEFHVKWQPAHRVVVYERNLDWFNFWLREVEDSDPKKIPQYQRWRQLRKLQSMQDP